ncbi:MAG TPA: ThiF family adenylyltransferase [Baekduia sp.]|nr:ThiF family adenylyltransferase [Baekduia sp.]
MHEVDTTDPASLDRFRAELIEAGFRGADGGGLWTGPIAPPLRAFTAADEMTLVIRDGWPYVHPDLRVEGMASVDHVDDRGVVCLWRRGDPSQQWRTLDGLRARIAEWCERQATGFAAADATTDAHAYFGRRSEAMAILPLLALTEDARDGDHGRLSGQLRRGRYELAADRGAGPLRGRWFYRRDVAAAPRTLGELKALLTREQRDAFARGRLDLVLLAWGRPREPHGVLLALGPPSIEHRRRRAAGPVAEAVEIAPDDRPVLLARAGDDAAWLQHHAITIFGAGAVGSHVALLLAGLGVGTLLLVDGDRLRPGNIIRHVVGHEHVGRLKVDAVGDIVVAHAPWITVEAHDSSPWAPRDIRELAGRADLVVDATGNAGFTEQLSVVLHDAEPMIAAALYRRGAVARVSRQAPGDTLIAARGGAPNRYPAIPRDDEPEDLSLEAGCSAPVITAPVTSVAGCARLTAAVVVDQLAGTRAYRDEVVEVYLPLDRPPFDRLGLVHAG